MPPLFSLVGVSGSSGYCGSGTFPAQAVMLLEQTGQVLLLVPASHFTVQDFGAVALPSIASSAPRFLIADDATKRIFFRYLP